jgi:glycosyltransferase involved in cell wall biosynthesis
VTILRSLALRILHAYKVYWPDADGGIPSVMSGLARNTHQESFHSILSARRFGPGRKYTLDGVPVEAVTSFGTVHSMPLAPGYFSAFRRSVREAGAIVHHAPFPLTDAAMLLGLPADVAVIVYWHADIIGHPLFKRLVSPILRRALARADKIVVSGTAMIESSDLLKPHAAKCEVLPYGVDLDYWRTLDAEDAAKVEQIKQQHPRHIVAVGRLVSYKGFDVLVRAMRDVDACATIVGGGPLHDQLSQLAAGLGVSTRIHFAGRLERRDIKRLFHAAQIFAFPSVNDAEAFGIAQIEAMSTGLPVVNTQLRTTVPWVARHDQEALTVQPNDPGAFAQALNSLLDQPALAQRLGAAAYARATDEFALDVFRARMTAVYNDAIRAREALN